MMGNQDALDRLSTTYRVEVDEVTKDRHIAEMSAALRTAPAAPIPTGFALRRRIAGAAAAVLVVVAPVGMAVAAEDSVPGEFLYPLKQVTERVRAFVGDDVAATHRVEEAERLVIRGAPLVEITRAVERAEIATSELVEDANLGSRLESVRERLRAQDERERGLQQGDEPQPNQTGGSGQGSNNAVPSHGQNDPGDGSATTVPPRSAGSGDGDGNRSMGGDSVQEQPSPPDGNADDSDGEGGSGTPEGHEANKAGDASPSTTAQQGSGEIGRS